MKRAASVVLWSSVVLSLGCRDSKSSEPVKAAASTPPPKTPDPPKPPEPRVPDVLVDDAGAYIGGERIELKSPESTAKLAAAVAKHPLAGKKVTVVALRNARTPDVVKTVSAIGDKAASVEVRTQNRDKKDVTIALEPDQKAGKLPDCTMAVMVLKDRATASWHVRGGVATKYLKGMAGPDMSQTAEGVAKQSKACPASTALVLSGDDSVEWGLVFDLSQMGEPKAPVRYVLPRVTPIAGQPVKLGDQ